MHSCVYCIQLVMWGKYGATCLAHSFLSVLTLFSNKKVVHSIKSLFMLQEMAAKNSASWSALKTPLHGWHFSSIFPQTYLACQCPVKCSACPWTICSANRISMCYSKVWSAVSYSLKVSRRHCRRQEGSGTVGCLLQPLGNARFSLWEKPWQGSELLWTRLYSSTANCSSLESPPQRGFLGWPKSRVRSVMLLLGQVVTTKLCVRCKKQLGKGKKKKFFSFFGQGRGGTWLKIGCHRFIEAWPQRSTEVPGSTSASSPRAASVPPCPIPGLGMSQAAASLLGWGHSEEPVALKNSSLPVGLRYSICSEKLTLKKK